MKNLVKISILLACIVLALTGSSFAQKDTQNSTDALSPAVILSTPAITGFSPTSGSGGTVVTITGTNFTGATAVSIDGVNIPSFTVSSATQIVATVSDGATTGKIAVTASGTGTSNLIFTIFPRLDNFAPTSGAPLSKVIITGGNFTDVNSVKFNGSSASFTRNSPQQITATVPAHATNGKITLGTPSASTQSTGSFTILHAPVISRFTPTRGAAGTVVSITGSYFDIATSVTFNGVPAPFTVVSSTEVDATLPANATKGKITVSSPAGSDNSGSSFTVLPGIKSFTPTSGIIGTSVTITGTGLTGASSVKFNGIASSFTQNSDTSITATVPTRATAGPISVTTSAGTASSGTSFTILPQVTNFTPTSGAVGTSVNITGSSFTGVSDVQFNGVSSSFSVRSTTSITAIVPVGAATGAISVITSAGTATSSTNFSVTGPSSGLTVTSFSPLSGLVGATVIIKGTGFTGITDVRFNNVSSTFTVNSPTQISATVPTAASSGQISVLTTTATGLSSANFSVMPQFGNFTPASGPAGSSVVITGSGFVGTNSVTFNGVSAGFTINSATQITTTVPASASTGKISVSTPSGTVTSAANFTLAGPPTITSFSPSRGVTGTTVSIFGSGFVSPSVTIGGIAASITVVTASQINASVPSTATTGSISVTTTNGSVTSATQFIVLPSITSFSPTSGPIGTSVIISGSGFSSVNSVTMTGKNASFTVNSPTQITVTIPSGAASGPLTVIAAAGTISSASNFTVTSSVSPPTISSFSPLSGPVGTSVAINGTNFTGATSVQFNGVIATTFSVVSSTQISATVPAGASTGKVSVSAPGGTATSTADFSVTASATLSSFSPTTGTVGTTVLIVGTNLSGVTAVQFNGASATFSILSATQISATVPSGASTGKIAIVAPTGTILSAQNFSVTPQVTSFTPTSGTSGTPVTITGSGFIGATGVKFNGISATFTINSATQITANAPSGASSGKVSVITPTGTATSAGDFTFSVPPSIVSFTPAHGPTGTVVTIDGSSLTATDVQFNGVSGSFTQMSSSEVTATVPTSATTGHITVITSSGAVSTTNNFQVTPSISGFFPSSGPIGTTVIILGSGFSAVTTVAFNNRNASFTVDSPTQITTIVPAGATSGALSVSTSYGTATGNTYYVTPLISSFAPSSGTVGNTVFISGTGFNTVTSVQLNGSDVVYSATSSTVIRVTIPIGATSGPFTVTTTAGTTTSTDTYTVIAPISISGFSPGCVEVGNTVTITGTSFIGVTEVLIDTSFCLFTVPSSTQIIARVPATAVTGRITVVSSIGTAMSATDFVPVNIPNIVSFTPDNGPVGTPVVIYGSGFCTTQSVDFNGTFAVYTVNSDVQITVTVPNGATTGAITVINTVGSFTTATNFTVTPNITGFNPTSGYIGDNVTLTGTNFLGATDVSFNGVSATFTVNSYSQVSTTVPVGATTGYITITTPDGTDASLVVFEVLPRIDSFSPANGIVGDPVTINGSGLNSASSVTFNGTSAGFTIVSSQEIDATVPSGATTGTIHVVTPVGSATSSTQFSVQPNITGFTPVNGGVGDTIKIFGSAFTGLTSVTFNGIAATFILDSYSQIRAIVPGSSSTGTIAVTTTSGTATSGSSFTVLPKITNFTPTSGVIGTPVSISGSTFTSATTVTFNGTPATFSVISDILINTTVPSGATTGTIGVTTPDGTTYSSASFTVLPDVNSFSPTSGIVGTPVDVSGTGFTGATSVKFNGVSASFTVNSDVDISTTVPNNALTGPISVTTPSGTNSSSSNFIIPPNITSFLPLSGIPGTSVVISGTAFTGATSVDFNGTTATYTVNSYSQITATVPAGATSGVVHVTTPSGTGTSGTSFLIRPNITGFAASSGYVGDVVTLTGTNFTGATSITFNGVSASTYTVVSPTQINVTVPASSTTGLITVTTPSGSGTSASNFTVLPHVVSFAPTADIVGNPVVLTGTSFTGASSVKFNGTSAAYTVNSDLQITATVPNGATTGTISVTTPSGTGTSSTSFGVQPTVSGFAPSGGIAGTSVIITGTAFTGATAVSFNGTSASYAINSYTQITATVPAGASTGTITVTNPAGSGSSASNFGVPPTVTSLSVPSGIIGSTVTLTGTTFVGVTNVAFNGVAAVTYTVVSPTQINATVPAGATTGVVSVTNAGGTGSSATSFTVLPNITSFSTPSGIVGNSITINGTAFTGASSVKFNGVSASYTVNSSIQITATVPSGATTGSVTVTTAAGTATSPTSFTVLPSIASFSPTNGIVGTSITINGEAFTGATTVTFNGTTASFSVVSNFQITATVPNGATTGTIAVTTPSGTGTSGSSFTVNANIGSFLPTSGIIGSSVVITGTAFTGATAVKFNGTSAVTFSVDSYSQITATVPAGATTGAISVTTAAGTVNSASNYTVLPNITSFVGTSGIVGTSVTINGTGFTGASAVKFNGVSSSYVVNSSIQITATVPSGANTGFISVTTAAGTATSSTSYTVTPSISSFSPGNGIEGASVTINGEAFTGATTVTFNGTSATFTVVSNFQITTSVPVGATTGAIAVTTPSGTGTSASNFSVTPHISGFSPGNGVIGSSIAVTGTTFTGAITVSVNGVNAGTYTVVTSTHIDVTVPAGATTGLISVTTPSGTGNSSTSYVVLPDITGFSTSTGVVGTGITINGSAFTGASSVKFNGVTASYLVTTSTAISATVPSGAITGSVTVTTAAGTATSATFFTIPPTISSFGPGSGLVGDIITITGEAFTGATDVSFNGTSASFSVTSATSISATVPTGATSGTISVTTPSGMATSGSSFTVLPKLAILDNLNAMLVLDTKGFQQRLYFGKVADENTKLAKTYELRPLQKGMFDVRFESEAAGSNGKLVELFGQSVRTNQQYHVKIQSATYPLTVYFSPGKSQNAVVWVTPIVDGNKLKTIQMTKSGDFRIEEAGATELLVEVGDAANLPTKFVLQQNYPNPFNPATTIQYSLPGQYWVSLKVYNMLGEEVADVVEDQKEQGTYEATWNANDKPSGVYTYRLIAFDLSNRSKEAFIQVKKMLLLK